MNSSNCLNSEISRCNSFCTEVLNKIPLYIENPNNPNDDDIPTCFFSCDNDKTIVYDLLEKLGRDSDKLPTFTDSQGNVIRVNPTFRIANCNGINQFSIEGFEIEIISNGSGSVSEEEITKFIIEYGLGLLTVPGTFAKYNVKIPCLEEDPNNSGSYILCEPVQCCAIIFDIYLDNNYTLYINEIIEGCDEPGEQWQDDVPNIQDFDLFTEINAFKPLGSSLDCSSICYWHTDGNDENELPDDHFIGPTNGDPFVIKTFNNSNSTLMNRMIVDSDNKIDFKLNAWYSMPQITFDAEVSNGLHKHDPMIKIYRQTGLRQQNGNYESFPWWIGVSNQNGSSYGALNFFGGSASYIGQADATMNKFLSILRNGNVGIGVEEPTAKLSVDGDAKINGIIYGNELIIDDPSEFWPDFVFSPSYKLPSLFDVNNFIKENGHLPNIPSAKEVENGVKVLELQKQMLQKIEELTLYMIELKQENEKLKEEVEALKGE